MKNYINFLLIFIMVICMLLLPACGDKNNNGDEPTPVLPGDTNKPIGSEAICSFGATLQSTIYDNNRYTYVVYVGFNIEKAFSSDVTEFGVIVSTSNGELAVGNSTSSITYNKKIGSDIFLYGFPSSDKSYAFSEYVYVTSSKSHIALTITPRWYIHSDDQYKTGFSKVYEFDADAIPSNQENNNNQEDDDSEISPGDTIEEQERWNEPLSYSFDGMTYDMILVNRPGMRSFRIMQTELPVSKDLKIGDVWIDKADRNGDGILIKSEFSKFLDDLRHATGCPFRLPRKDEWEFAAKGGIKSKGYVYSGSNSLDEVGWYKENSYNALHEPLLKAANELNIYDMSGNYAELCNESSDDIAYVDGPICGGCYKDMANNCKITSYTEGSRTGNVTGTKLKEKNAVDTRYIALRLVYYCNE